MLFFSREMLPDTSEQPGRHISPATAFSRRLPLNCFPALSVASTSMTEISGGVMHMRNDLVEDMLSRLSCFVELARLTTGLECSYSLGLNNWLSVSTLLAGLCWRSLFENTNSLFSIFHAQASTSPTCRISY